MRFGVDELSAGRAQRNTSGTSSALVRYELPKSPLVRIVDVDTSRECPQDVVGEIWVHGDNVAAGYWS
ncbi:acyl-CoA synthetase, partial [Mycobacterium sp. ITM-2017-0098]